MPEAARIVRATPVVSFLVVVLGFLVPAAVLATTGLNIEAQGAILRRVDEVGARTITVLSTADEPVIPSAAVDRIARLEGVAWVVGLGPVFDARRTAPGGQPTPVRSYRAVDAPVMFSGQMPGAYLSTTSAGRLGLAGAFSVVEPGPIAVVGWFLAAEPLAGLEAFILVPIADDEPRLERIIVAADDVGWVELIAANLGLMLGNAASSEIIIQRSDALLQAREAVQDELARRDRFIIVGLLAASMVLAAVVVFAGTLAARRDFGRRRALGATRPQLVVLVVLTTLLPATLGALIGTAAGWAYLGLQLDRLPEWEFPVSLGILAILALSTASALPAAVAATRDPLRVLRIP